jgi:cytochrome c-type biogenesis protein
MAGQNGQMALSAAYLAVYSLGLGLPFLAAALCWNTLIRRLESIRAHQKLIQTISGIFIAIIGVFVMMGRFSYINALFLTGGYALSSWSQSGGLMVRLLPVLVFLLIGGLPFLLRLRGQQKPLRPASWIVFGIFLLLSAAQLTGLINCAALISKWLSYAGL